jgi:hypothetical protein
MYTQQPVVLSAHLTVPCALVCISMLATEVSVTRAIGKGVSEGLVDCNTTFAKGFGISRQSSADAAGTGSWLSGSTAAQTACRLRALTVVDGCRRQTLLAQQH